MIENNHLIKDTPMAFFISNNKFDNCYGVCTEFPNGIYISHTAKTDCRIGGDYDYVCIIGFCVDARGSLKPEEIPTYLSTNSDGEPEKLAELLKLFAGNYAVLFYSKKYDGLYLFPDASASLPVYYSNETEKIVVSSNDRHIAEYLNYEVSDKNIVCVHNTLSYNDTVYDNVKALLPNTYIDLYKKQIVRIPARIQKKSLSAVIDETIKYVNTIIKEYRKYYDFKCPITGGYDSRLNVAFCLSNFGNSDIDFYTMDHTSYPVFDRNDVIIPQRISEGMKLNHIVFEDKLADDEMLDYVMSNLSECQSDFTDKQYIIKIINIANTLKSLGVSSFLQGHVVDHIGKSGAYLDFPIKKINAQLLSTLMSGKSEWATKSFENWLKDIEDKRNTMDYFALESDCARWAAFATKVNYLFGITTLNIYNCGYLIELWMGIPRMRRARKIIHLGIFKKIQPELLKYNFIEESRAKRIFKKLPIFMQKIIYYYLIIMEKI